MTPDARIDQHDPGEKRSLRIAAIGEVLWDVFPSGPRFGGAPANFACTCSGLARDQATVEMVSAVGQDELGNQAIACLQQHNVNTQYVLQIAQPTGEVRITLNESGAASYQFADNCAWDNLPWSAEMEEAAANLDAVCFGTLGQRSEVSRSTIQRFLRATQQDCLRVYDINIRPPYHPESVIRDSLRLANVLKLNDEELPFLASLFALSGTDEQLLDTLADQCELETIALTCGPNGAKIWHKGALYGAPGHKCEVVDTVGAGDSFTAAMILGLLNNEEVGRTIHRACEIAAYVCSQPGATPDFPAELLNPQSAS